MNKEYVLSAITLARKDASKEFGNSPLKQLHVIQKTNAIEDKVLDGFCKQIGLSEPILSKSQIKDVQRMIVTCFEEFQKENPDVAFTQEKFDAIIIEIKRSKTPIFLD